jgi:hypothetical protein
MRQNGVSMTQESQEQVKNSSHDNDEIDLRELFLAIWNTRKAVVVMLVLISCIYWASIIVSKMIIPSHQVFTKQVDFVFSGVEAGKYPSGTIFRLADILAPVIVRRVYDKQSIGDYDLSFEDFLGGFTVSSYSPKSEGILIKYKNQLATKGISAAESAQINSLLAEELARSERSSAIIRFTSPQGASLPNELINTVMHDLPAEWSRFMINEKGVVKFAVPLYSEGIVDTELFKALDHYIAYDLLIDKVNSIKRNISELQELPGSEVVIDNVTTLSLQDLEQALDDLSTYDIEAVWLPIRSLGVMKNPDLTKYYFENKMLDLQQTHTELKNKAAIAADAYDSYANNGAKNGGNNDGNYSAGNVMPQLSGEFLDRLIKMGGKDSEQAFRQDLSKQRVDYANEAAEIEFKIAELKSLLSSIEETKNKKQQVLRGNYQAQAEAQLPIILDKLKGYIRVTHGIYEKLNKESFGYIGMLYRDSGKVIISKADSILSKTILRNYILLLLLLVFVTIPVVMVRHSMKRFERERQNSN